MLALDTSASIKRYFDELHSDWLVHLAALRSLPDDCRFITFDRSQSRAAVEPGIETLVPPGF